MDGVVALLLVLDDHRQLAEIDVPLLQIILTSNRTKIENFRVLRQRHHDAVDVGQLIARRVDDVIIWVPLHHPCRRVDRPRCLPRAKRRQVRIERPVLLEVDEFYPILIAFLLGQLVGGGIGGILRQELFQIVLRRIRAISQALALPPRLPATDQRISRHDVVEQVERLVENELHRRLVHLDEFTGLAVDAHLWRGRRHQFLVLIEVLEPEHEIISREWRTIRPLHALAQRDRKNLAVSAHIQILRHARHDLGAGVIPKHELVGRVNTAAVLDIARAIEAAPPRATILADRMHRFQHQRLRRQPILHRRQLPSFHLFGKDGRFLKRLRHRSRIRNDRRTFKLSNQTRLGDGAVCLLGRGTSRRKHDNPNNRQWLQPQNVATKIKHTIPPQGQ